MKIFDLLNEATLSSEMKKSFDAVYHRIASNIKGATGINVSSQWLAGMLNQSHNFRYLDASHRKYQEAGNKEAARDLEARIIARNEFARVGLLNKANGYLPKNRGTLSSMRQYYAQAVNDIKAAADTKAVTRGANDAEGQDWYNSLPAQHKSFVNGLQEFDPEDLALFKGIIKARQSKKEFITRLHSFVEENPASAQLRQMNILTDNDELQPAAVEDLREFLASLTPARLKDVVSKGIIYSTKKMTHDEHRAKNAVLKDMEKSKHGVYATAFKVYNYVSKRIGEFKDKDRAFRRFMSRLPMTRDSDGQLNQIGVGATALFRQFKGQLISKSDRDRAIEELNKAYTAPATGNRRAAKSATRGETLGSTMDI